MQTILPKLCEVSILDFLKATEFLCLIAINISYCVLLYLNVKKVAKKRIDKTFMKYKNETKKVHAVNYQWYIIRLHAQQFCALCGR